MVESAFQHTHRVTYAECTAGNHIYYSRYLDLLEAARGEFFRHLGKNCLQWQESNTLFPVLECRLQYKSPARYDDVLTITVRPIAAEKVRLNFDYLVHNQNNLLLLEAETRHVCTGLNEKPKRLPPELSAALKPFLPKS